MSTKPWGGAGAWAAEAEREEAELAAAAQAEPQSFPSLKESVSTKPKKKKQTISLNQFNMGAYSATGTAVSGRVGLTPDEMMRLPTGPQERSAEEMQYGRGFSSYGQRSGSNMGRGRDREDGDGQWGGGGRRSYGGFDDERRGPQSRVSDFDQPSRADEVDNWAMSKKSLPSVDSGRQNRYSSLGGGGGGGGGGRADDVDNWAVGKKVSVSRSTPFGSGYRDSVPEPDRWVRGGPDVDRVERGRPRLVFEPRKGGELGVNESLQVAKTNKPSPFGAARPREEILAEKGLDWKKLDSETEAKKTSRPTSAHSSRPSSAQSSRSEGPGALHVTENEAKPRPKVNPFGDAKPREVLLEEQGKDWRKIDQQLEHRSVDRPETEEERILKEEIGHLKKELEKESANKVNSEAEQESGGNQPSLHDTVLQRERDLEALIRDLDDKVRFGQKAVDRPGSGAGRPGSGAGRPGSGAGRSASFLDRTPSHSGSYEDSRNVEFIDRPPLQGKGDPWARPYDDRRSSFHGGRERGFLGNRDLGRARSRERW